MTLLNQCAEKINFRNINLPFSIILNFITTYNCSNVIIKILKSIIKIPSPKKVCN